VSAGYSLRDVGKLLGLPRSIICGAAGLKQEANRHQSAYRKLSNR
jgi:hypothetical protein